VWSTGHTRSRANRPESRGFEPAGDLLENTRMVVRASLALVLVAGCTYKPGSFRFADGHVFGEHITVGCLDVNVARRPDLAKSAVLEYQFGNRCSRAALVDLATVEVRGRTARGRELRLAPYDPAGELTALQLGGRSDGSESLAYPAREPLVEVCVDAATLAHAHDPRWVCFARLDQSGEPSVSDPEDPDDPDDPGVPSGTDAPGDAGAAGGTDPAPGDAPPSSAARSSDATAAAEVAP
jgi:hypothetical protein